MRPESRLAGAVVCALLAGVAARGGIADAVFARGDDAARAGHVAVAESYYDRAVAIGGDSLEGLERYALLALLTPRGRAFPSAVRSANAFLAAHGRSGPGHFDRGLIEWRAGAYAAAASDFGMTASIGHDPRATTFAAAALRRISRERGRDRG